MTEASPRETLPKNLWPAETNSSGPKVAGPGSRCGGWYCDPGACCGYCGGGPCCADAGAVQHISAATAVAAMRDAKVIKNPWYRNAGHSLNLTPTSKALGCVQCPLDSNVIGTNYDGTTAGKIWLPPRNGLFRPIGQLFRRPWP